MSSTSSLDSDSLSESSSGPDSSESSSLASRESAEEKHVDLKIGTHSSLASSLRPIPLARIQDEGVDDMQALTARKKSGPVSPEFDGTVAVGNLTFADKVLGVSGVSQDKENG